MKKLVLICLLCLAIGLPGGDVTAFGAPSIPPQVDQSPLTDTLPGDEFWDDRFPGKGFTETPLTVAVDGSDVYAGGTFELVDGVFVNGIAKWDGTQTVALGGGVSGCRNTNDCSPTVQTIVVQDDAVYIGGDFTAAGGVAANFVAKWDGAAWSPVGAGFDAPVSALAFVGETLYAGGSFLNSGATSLNHIAWWDGTAWQPLDEGVDGSVRVFAVDGVTLYAGGDFIQAGALAVNHIARWDGTDWSAIGDGLASTIDQLGLNDGKIFATLGENHQEMCLQEWNGTAWQTHDLCWIDYIRRGATWVTALGTFQDNIYASTRTTYPGNGSAWLRLEDTGWKPITNYAFGNYAVDMTTNEQRLVVVHGCDMVCPYANEYVRSWDGSAWSAFFNGANSNRPDFHVMAGAPGGLYVGGSFTQIGNKAIEGVAFWNGTEWTSLGSGIQGTVHALAVHVDRLYAGGLFFQAGGTPVNNIAMWDGHAWSALGQGVDFRVLTMATTDENVFVGGQFHHAGGLPIKYIARWDGTAWHALGEGTNKAVWQIVASKTDVYASGEFKSAGGIETGHLAHWNGKEWQSLPGRLVRNYRGRMVLKGRVLYFGNHNTLWRWNWDRGSKWTLPGDSNIQWLAFRGEDLILGGTFESPSVDLFHIGHWKGNTLEPLAAINNRDTYLLSLATYDRDIYVTGYFSIAGGKPSGNFGIWHDPAPAIPQLFAPPNKDSLKKDSIWLRWIPSAGAVRYDLQIRRHNKQGNLILDTSVDRPGYLTSSLRRGTTFFWRVRACSPVNEIDYCSSWTKWWRFSIEEK